MVFNPDFPIVLGVSGKACTGKTSVGNVLAPTTRILGGIPDKPDLNLLEPLWWDHLFYAMPIYAMASARRGIEGVDAYSRQCYDIHNILLEIWPNPIWGA